VHGLVALGYRGDSEVRTSNAIVAVVRGGPAGADPIDVWRHGHFGFDAANALIAGNLADPDGDGWSNVMEYSFATHPLQPDAGATGPVPSASDGTLQVTFERAAGAHRGSAYVFESSDDLNLWQSITPVVIAGPVPLPGGTTERITYADPGSAGQPRRFLRMRVEALLNESTP
jgi:hypothetical protein